MATKKKSEYLPEDTEILTTKKSKAPDVKRVSKGSRQFMHDLYKLEVAKHLKNTSYKEFQPMLIHLEHCHFYHSHNSRGKPQTRASLQNGHTHDITVKADTEGNLVAECGPPLKQVKRQMKSGKVIKLWKPIEYLDESGFDEAGEMKKHVDTHRHKITYQHSEELSDKKIKDIHAADKVRFATLQAPDTATAKPTETVKAE